MRARHARGPSYRDSAAAGYAEARRREAHGRPARPAGRRASMAGIERGIARARAVLAWLALAALAATVALALYGAIEIAMHGF